MAGKPPAVVTTPTTGSASGWPDRAGCGSPRSTRRTSSGTAPGAAALTALRADGQWIDLLPRTELLPDTRHRFLVDVGDVVSEARLDIYPDGGLARLRLFGELA